MESAARKASDADDERVAATRRARRGRVLHALLSSLSAISRRLPLNVNRAAGRTLGTLAYYVDIPDRRTALENITRAFPDWTRSRRRQVIRAMFRHLGASLFEILWLPRLDASMRPKTTTFEAEGPVLDLIDSGRAVIVFTGHCGNWEWLAQVVASFGRPVAVLQRDRNESEMNQFIEEIRKHSGIRTIGRGSASSGREIIQATRRGGFLAFLIDQSIRTESIKVPFFGTPAPTPVGPAKLATRTSAVAVAAFIERRPNGMQHVRFAQPIQCSPDDDPCELTARMTAAIEDQIRRVPEQWVWMHKRWRDRPKWDVSEECVHR